MARKKTQKYINGTFTHRRIESDYVGTLLDAVTLDDWRDVVASTVVAAKAGDASARMFLAQYLMGRPDTKAPAPVTVVLQQLSGHDPLIEKLAKPHIERFEYPSLNDREDVRDAMRALVADELRLLEAQKSKSAGQAANADGTRVSSESSP